MNASNSITAHSHSIWKDYVALTKPRITLLVLVTAYAGMWTAAGGPPDVILSLVGLLGIGLASASSAVLNNYFDRDIDGLMNRTQHRPLPSGSIEPRSALWFGLNLNLLAFATLLLGVNPLSAWLALGTVFVYVVIYTLWLKRTTPLCTSIGGIAGALPPVIGWAVVAGDIGLPALVMFGILFLWQPPHFWSLAMLRTEEYRRANIPMLPVVKGNWVTKRQMLLYTILLLPISLLPYQMGWISLVYFYPALVLGVGYICLTIFAVISKAQRKAMYRLFGFSILYLFTIFLLFFVG